MLRLQELVSAEFLTGSLTDCLRNSAGPHAVLAGRLEGGGADVGHPMTSMAAMRSFRRDPSVDGPELPKGTVRRILGIARPYRRDLTFFLTLVVGSSLIGVITPAARRRHRQPDRRPARHGRRHRQDRADHRRAGGRSTPAISLGTRWFSARIGEGVIYDLRSRVFEHVQRMPVAFFTRTQTGALVSRLNNDVIGAQQAFTSTLSGVVSNVIGLVLTAGVMFSLSWQITLLSLILVPLFVLPARRIGKRLQEITRESYALNASMNATMTERFNVAGALLVKLFGRPDGRGGVLPRPGGPGPRHRRPVGHVRPHLLHRADAGRRAGDRAGLRPGRLAGVHRLAERR